jgi:hypothetical protein
VDAFRENDGFPCNFFAFFNQSDITDKVEVKTGGSPSDVVITLRPKAAHLTIHLTDEHEMTVGKPMALNFSREDMPGCYRQSATAPYSMLVPLVPFSFSVEVKGYQPWRSESITLHPGETVTTAVKLQPE